MQSKQDFLGNEYKPGDYVIYAVTASQSINMIKAQVVEILDNGKVRLQPIAGSRWTSHRERSYFVDNRTGKRINPNLDTGRHYKDARCYQETTTGELITSAELRSRRESAGWRVVYGKYKFVDCEMEDYVETRTDPIKPVTISVTENIVKFADGELATEG